MKGIRLGVCSTGTRYVGRDDLALLELAPGSETICLFTKNKFSAAPVQIAREHISNTKPRYLVINSGNANAGTGSKGKESCRVICKKVADEAGCSMSEILPFSTGVIGEQIPAEQIASCVPRLFQDLREDNWNKTALAIMTTDTRPKLRSRTLTCSGFDFTITGIAKGSGMIKPDMATMLGYVATDAAFTPACLKQIAQKAVDRSFNSITVDGDTSTNDAFALISTGAAANKPIDIGDKHFLHPLVEGIEGVCEDLAKDIIRDGEGATKLITVRVTGGIHDRHCRIIADSVAHSPLVKTAFFAEDPNWGRILAAVGKAALPDLDIDKVSISIGNCMIVENGQIRHDYDEGEAVKEMRKDEVAILILVGSGTGSSTVWTCDYSYDYIKINAEYRT